jgi:hypothetical protein
LVIENKPNKDLIISMNIKQVLGNKNKKRKGDPPLQFVVITIGGSLLEEEELKHVSDLFVYLLSIGTPYY